MILNADVQVECLLASAIAKAPTLEMCRSYIERYPAGTNLLNIKQAMEPLLYQWSVRENSILAYEEYLRNFVQGANAADVLTRLDPLIFKQASAQDWYTDYEDYITRFPSGIHLEEAKNRLHYLRNTPGTFTIEFPPVVEGKTSPYVNVQSPFFGEWNTIIRETSGTLAFKARASGYIIDPKGDKWDPSRSIDKTPAGGAGKDDYWCSSPDHVLCNGYAVFEWIVEDAGGHTTTLQERVKLQHTGCPGPK